MAGVLVMQRADWMFPAEARSVPESRALLTQRLINLPDEALDVVRLLTSELVTNAVRHGTGPVLVRVAWGDGQVRVEVEDRSPQRPVVRSTDHDSINGRGLGLVDGLSTTWGVLPARHGKRVWFTVDAPLSDDGRPLERRSRPHAPASGPRPSSPV